MDYNNYIREEFGSLEGRTIVKVRPLMQEELDDLYWDSTYPAFVIIFDDGSCVIPSADAEGNAPGHLFLGGVS